MAPGKLYTTSYPGLMRYFVCTVRLICTKRQVAWIRNILNTDTKSTNRSLVTVNYLNPETYFISTRNGRQLGSGVSHGIYLTLIISTVVPILRHDAIGGVLGRIHSTPMILRNNRLSRVDI